MSEGLSRRDLRFTPAKKQLLKEIEEGLYTVNMSPRLTEGLRDLKIDALRVIHRKIASIALFDSRNQYELIESKEQYSDYLRKRHSRVVVCEDLRLTIQQLKEIRIIEKDV